MRPVGEVSARLARRAVLWADTRAAVVAVFAYRVLNLWLPLIPAALGLRELRRVALKREQIRDLRRKYSLDYDGW